MNLLAIDTTQGVTSLALCLNSHIVATFQDSQLNRQAAMLVPHIQHFVRAHGIEWDELDGFICTEGPGGFTSVRIGIAVTRGLAFASGKPCYGVPLGEVMAYYAMRTASIASVTCVIPAGRKDVTTQFFQLRQGRPIAQGALMLESLSTFRPVKPLCALNTIPEHSAVMFPIAETAQELTRLFVSVGASHYAAPAPVYARPPDAAPGKALLSS